ncbi:MAG: hypothetical protein M0Q94_10220 [Candidatus Cloacimonetes bacterium]|jgi:uncharacterized protein (UPF0305 family)|nr:hypothetical protein [Candidatus Cloacimonadota bacterium]
MREYWFIIFIDFFFIFSLLLTIFLVIRILKIRSYLLQNSTYAKPKKKLKFIDIKPLSRYIINPIINNQKTYFKIIKIPNNTKSNNDKISSLKADYNLRISTAFKMIGNNNGKN